MSNDWELFHGPEGIGSGGLRQRLEESLRTLEKRLGVPIPDQGRHRQALDLLDNWSTSIEGAPDASMLEQMAAAQRFAWDFFVITATAFEERNNPNTPLTGERLATLLAGDLMESGSNSYAQNLQFESYVGAAFRLAGASVKAGEPDFLTLLGSEEVGVAVKRVRSLNVDQVQQRAREAEKQIAKTRRRGWIAMSIESRIRERKYDPEDNFGDQFAASFAEIHGALRRPADKQHVLGFLLFGQNHTWVRRHDSQPPLELHWGAPLQWIAFHETDEEGHLIQEYMDRWTSGFSKRLGVLGDPSFQGIL